MTDGDASTIVLEPDWRAGDGGPPRCMGCGYVIVGLGDVGRCPECGRGFDLYDPRTYLTKPPFVGWRFWMPGLLTAMLAGIGAMAGLVLLGGAWGWSVWVGAPLGAGVLMGYRGRAKWSVMALLCMVLLAGLCMGVFSMQLGGVFCGLVLGGLALVPVMVGAVMGVVLRKALKRSSFDQRWYLPVLVYFGAMAVCGALDRPPAGGAGTEVVITSRVIGAEPGRVWESLVFYEEVTHRAPLILRIGLARPLWTTGSARAVGDVKVCVYNKGHITKRVTEATPPWAGGGAGRLAFDVIDQAIGYERDVRLIDGSFELTPAEGGGTLVTLTTRYEPLLRPRLGWRWGERWGVHTLHGHVLEGIRRRAEGKEPERVAARLGGAP